MQTAVTMPFVVPCAPALPRATWTSYGLTTPLVLPLAARCRAALTVLVAVLAAGGLYKFAADGPGRPLPYTGLMPFHTVAELSSPPERIAGALVTAVAVPVSTGLDSIDLREPLSSLFVFAAAGSP
ncbi:hypothetical protein [Streptomyces sp. NPDC092903]|uniref:hypothetical protein n=1 Tax=Streptomyces sp. NPDC092903 TaxID=3366017 RepID=UPI00380A5358